MGEFRREGGSRFGGNRGGSRFGGDRGGRPSFGGRDNRDKEMFSATCSECQKDCQVPFRPSNGKPIFCNDCFSKQKGDDRGGREDRFPRRDFNDRGARPSFEKRSFDTPKTDDGVKVQLEAINSKLEKLIRSIESMTRVSAPVEKTIAKVEAPKVVVADKKAVKAVVAPAKKAAAKKKVSKK
ncbi:MAG: CxxC-x17-CxxC domain-containing protein [bacterium]